MMADPLPWVLVLIFALLFAAAAWGWSRARTRVARANRARLRTAQRAESDAELLLERSGFAILERQAVERWAIEVDGRREEVQSRADLLVARRGRLYVADVKSGEQAPDPRRPGTRRQLLEYLLAFGADGALVVDMSERRIHRVSFQELLFGG